LTRRPLRSGSGYVQPALAVAFADQVGAALASSHPVGQS
jgi:hypothetical protein